jgi:hypothetical protein
MLDLEAPPMFAIEQKSVASEQDARRMADVKGGGASSGRQGWSCSTRMTSD